MEVTHMNPSALKVPSSIVSLQLALGTVGDPGRDRLSYACVGL